LKDRADALAAHSEALKQQLAGGVSPTVAAAVAQFEGEAKWLNAELAAHVSAETEIATPFKKSVTEISELQRLTAELRSVYPRWFSRTMDVLTAPLERPFAALRKRPMLRIVAGVGWYVVLAAFLPGFPWYLVAVAGAWIAGNAFDRAARRLGRLTVGSVWPAALVLLASGAISYGLQPYAPRASYVRFAADVGYPAGWYALLGRDADTLYLRPCDPNVPYMLNVRADLVPSIQTLPSRLLDSPNAIGYLTGTPIAVGISRTCGPHPDTP